MSGLSLVEFFKLATFYLSWIYFPAAAALVYLIARGGKARRRIAAATLAVATILAYARFIEPRMLVTATTPIELKRCFAAAGRLKIALVSDIHNGLFANAVTPARLARAIAETKPDAVMIAGDSTYYLDPNRFDEIFRPLGAIGAPVFAVMGNHDVGIPGPDIGDALSASFARVGLRAIDNMRVDDAVRGVEIVGLSDVWQGRQDLGLLAAPSDKPRIVLTHNPTTIEEISPGATLDLLLAGHTHGGQVYIPFLTCGLIHMACDPVRRGYGEANGRQLFVTSGVGMVGLPIRFLVPPRIDVLEVSYEACPGGGVRG